MTDYRLQMTDYSEEPALLPWMGSVTF